MAEVKVENKHVHNSSTQKQPPAQANSKQPINVPVGQCNLSESQVAANIQADFLSGALSCKDNLCIFDAKQYKKATKGQDYLTIGEIKCRYNVPKGALTTGTAGEANGFTELPTGENYDNAKPSEVNGGLHTLKDIFMGRISVYIPKEEISKHSDVKFAKAD